MPRKSDPGPIPGAGPPLNAQDPNGVSIDENVLPRSIVTRLAKGVLPQNTNIQKDAVLALTKGATVFINYLCTAANENAVKANKKTIMPKDVLEAISQLELDEFGPRLQAELAKFEEITSEKRAAAKKAAAAKEAGKPGPDGSPTRGSPTNPEDNNGADEDAEIDTPPPAKKRKANGKTTLLNGASKTKKGIAGASGRVDVDEGEDDLGDDKDYYQEEEEEEEVYDEEEVDEAQDVVEEDVVEDLDEVELREDEALDNGYDSD